MQVGCTTYSYTSRSTSVRQRVINSERVTADVTVDYQKRVTATSDFQKFPSQARQQAIYQCIMNSGIDLLVDPIFQVENRPVTGYRATVTGFAGYYKVGKDELDKIVEKNYTQEEIEKYLLLTDPEFRQYYYQSGTKEGNVYNIKCGNQVSANKSTTVVPSNLTFPKKAKKNAAASANKSDEYKKAKRLRDIGIGLSCTGFFCWAGIPMAVVGANKMKKNQ